MNEKIVSELKTAYKSYLDTFGLEPLRAVGRKVGLSAPTKLKKEPLIDMIVSVLIGAISPVLRSNRGAPVKMKASIDPAVSILNKLKEICRDYGGEWMLSEEEALEEIDVASATALFKKYGLLEEKNVLSVHSSEMKNREEVFVGQVEKTEDFYCLLPLNGREFTKYVFLDSALVQSYALREGDVVSCFAKESNSFYLAKEILKINERLVGEGIRKDFESESLVSSASTLPLTSCKFFDWFLPIAKGSRAIVVSPPKAGKTTLLKGICEDLANVPNIKTFGLLLEQAPETAYAFQKILSDRDLAYTTYGEEADLNVFQADFMLKRAKRYAETGRDVVLIVDGLQALARSYEEIHALEETAQSNVLQLKTLRYLQKYLTASRAFEGGGSLTIICECSVDTGNEDDDVFYKKLAPIFNAQIVLNGSFAKKRIFPAIDVLDSFSERLEDLLSEEKAEIDLWIRREYLPVFGSEALCRLVEKAKTVKELYELALLDCEKK